MQFHWPFGGDHEEKARRETTQGQVKVKRRRQGRSERLFRHESTVTTPPSIGDTDAWVLGQIRSGREIPYRILILDSHRTASKFP